jgi:hypothetical protein
MAGERERRATGELGTIPFRMEQVEAHVKEQRMLNEKVSEGLWAIRALLEKGIADMAARVDVHDKAKKKTERYVHSIGAGLAVAVIMAVATFAITAYRVQSARLP